MSSSMGETPNKNQAHEQLVETWNRAREMIKDENTLINQRLSWMLTAQAFLFAAIPIAVREADGQKNELCGVLLILFLLPVICMGFFSSLTVFRMARDAENQRKLAEEYWNKQVKKILGMDMGQELEDRVLLENGFPERIMGKDRKTDDFRLFSFVPGALGITRDHTFPKLLSFIWVFVFVLWCVFFWKRITA